MQRLLLLERHRLGDALMSLPFLREAGTRHEVHVACSPQARPVYELVLPPERIVTVGARAGPADVRALRKIGAATSLSGWADVRDHLLLRAAGIPRRVGFPMDEVNYYGHEVPWRRRNLRIGRAIQAVCCLGGVRPLTDRLRRRDYRQHHMADWAQLGEALGLVPRLDPPWLTPPPGPLPAPVAAFLERHAGQHIWLLHPGASAESKRWPHFARLVADVFAPRGVPLLVIDPPDSPPLAASYPQALSCRPASFREFVRIAARADVVLGNDSVASHTGAALGKHVVTLFGSSSSSWFAPMAERRTLIESSRCPVRPCFERCVQPSYLCLDGLSPERVAGEVERLFPS